MRNLIIAAIFAFSANLMAENNKPSEVERLSQDPAADGSVLNLKEDISAWLEENAKDFPSQAFDKVKKTFTTVIKYPKKAYDDGKITDANFIVEQRRPNGSLQNQLRMSLEVATKPLVSIGDKDWVPVEFTVSFDQDAKLGISLDHIKASVGSVVSKSGYGIKTEYLSFIHSQNKHLVRDFGSTNTISYVTTEVRDTDILRLGQNPIPLAGFEVKLIGKANASIGADFSDPFDLGITFAACGGANFERDSWNEWSISSEICWEYDKIKDYSSDSVEITLSNGKEVELFYRYQNDHVFDSSNDGDRTILGFRYKKLPKN